MRRVELDYAQIAAGIRADPAGAKLRGRDMEKLIRQVIKDRTRPGTQVVLVNKPGDIINVEGGRKYLVMRSGDLQQIAGEGIQLGGGEGAKSS